MTDTVFYFFIYICCNLLIANCLMNKKSILLLVALLYSLSSMAYDFSVDGISYDIISDDDKTVAVTRGDYKGDIVIPDSVSYRELITGNIKIYRVISISYNAFRNCEELTSVVIPESVIDADGVLFEGCTSLKSVSLPQNMTRIFANAFENCKSLTSIIIPENVTEIGWEAFWGCNSLADITIPEGVTSIGSNAFAGTPFYASLPDGLIYLGKVLYTYKGEKGNLKNVSINEGIVTIGIMAFSGCYNLSSITIPESVTVIGNEAFYQCAKLESVIIPKDVTVIEGGTFAGCSSLKSITLPDSITEIGRNAFSDCVGLTNITIPEKVMYIRDRAFSGCTGLESIQVAANNPFYDSRNDCNAIITSVDCVEKISAGNGYIELPIYNKDHLILGCNNTVIPNGVVCIDKEAFKDCLGLYSINIPKTVIDIKTSSFTGCFNLNCINVDHDNLVYDSRDNCNAIIETQHNNLILGCKNTIIPNSVISIGENAFLGVQGMYSLVIPEGVSSIKQGAFYGCNELKSIHMASTVVDIFDNKGYAQNGINPFEGCTNVDTLYWNTDVSSFCVTKYSAESLKYVLFGNNIKTIGDGALAGCINLSSIIIPEKVTLIGSGAFRDCAGLECVFMSPSVKYIYNSAFKNCSNLLSIVLPDSVLYIGEEAFYGCSKLTEIRIPNGVTTIQKNAFYDCRKLEIIILPDNLEVIKQGAFQNCSVLKEIIIPESVSVIEGGVFANCTNLSSVYLPQNITTIGGAIFNNCHSLRAITIPVGIKIIPSGLFNGCSGLTSVILSQGLTCIGDHAFSNCSGLSEIKIPDSVETIGDYAFENCSGLTSLTIPSNVSFIGICAFRSCSGLESIKVDINNAFFDSRNDCNAIIVSKDTVIQSIYSNNGILKWSGNKLILGCKNTIIPNDVTNIEYSAFYGCIGLKQINIPSSVNLIGTAAFEGCSGLEIITVDPNNKAYDSRNDCNAIIESIDSVESNEQNHCYLLTDKKSGGVMGYPTIMVYPNYYLERSSQQLMRDRLIVGCKNTIIPNSVKHIGDYSFAYCKDLNNISIPECVNTIGSSAFQNCSSLTSISIPKNISYIGSGILGGCVKLESIVVDDNNQVYDSRNGCNAIIETNTNSLIAGCVKTEIPDNVSGIAGLSFSGLYNLERIRIPSGVITIVWNAFYDCMELREITINSLPTGINNESFDYDNIILLVPDSLISRCKESTTWGAFKKIYPIGTPMEMNVMLSNIGYSTFYDTEDYELPVGLSAMVVSEVIDGKLKYEVIANGDSGDVIPAGVAVILKSEKLEEQAYKLSLSAKTPTYDGPNLLMGHERDTITYSNQNALFYKLAYGPSNTDLSNIPGWYWGAPDGGAFHIEAHKCWLAIPATSQTKGVAGYSLLGDPTSINMIKADNVDDEAIMYDLYGRRLYSPVGQGLMIINGQKVYVGE